MTGHRGQGKLLPPYLKELCRLLNDFTAAERQEILGAESEAGHVADGSGCVES